MNPLNRWQRFMIWLNHINLDDAVVKFKVNAALREQRRQGKEEGRQEKADCSICPWYKATTPHEMTAFEQRPPTTEGKLAVEGIRYRALRRHLQSHTGTLMKHDKQMREQSQRATDGPHTERVPKVPRLTVKLDPLPPT